MVEILIGLFTLYTLIRIYISVMQIGYISEFKHKEPILLPPAKYQIAANYAIKKERLSIVEATLEYLIFLFWIYGGFKWLQNLVGIEDNITNNLLFLFGFFIINYIITLPITIYKVFILDKSFHFSNTTPKLFIIDQIKQAIIFFIVGGAIFATLSYIISNFENWWIYGFIIIFLFIILVNMLYPTLIAPLFNKFKPLEDKELKTKIEDILKEVGLSSDGVFTIDASKRDSRLNAYFGGLGKSKRVVLFDTLLEKLNRDEIIAVLGHELGHYSHKDIYKNIATMGVFLFLLFFIVGNLPDSLFLEMGVVPTAGVKIALITLVIPIFSFIYMPIFGLISRHNEYEADKFGAKIGGKDNLIRALLKLVNENKSFPHSHPLYIFFYYSHPPIIKRLEALGYKDEYHKDNILLSFLNED
ncbi:MAG: M48 family metallopeptidase [Epsilonproteobacteria bacterium]|nr:M48 family metallopeptidase [Campylobacterota bacterium]